MSSQCQKLARHPDIIERMAAKAREEDRIVTRKEVMREIIMANRPNPGQAPPLPEGTYSVIYADPPWRYDAGTINPEKVADFRSTPPPHLRLTCGLPDSPGVKDPNADKLANSVTLCK
jgi:hypothetical protein